MNLLRSDLQSIWQQRMTDFDDGIPIAIKVSRTVSVHAKAFRQDLRDEQDGVRILFILSTVSCDRLKAKTATMVPATYGIVGLVVQV